MNAATWFYSQSFNNGAQDGYPDVVRCWLIQRCTQKIVGGQLQYEDFPTPEGLMTRARMLEVLDRVQRQNPQDEFRGHRAK